MTRGSDAHAPPATRAPAVAHAAGAARLTPRAVAAALLSDYLVPLLAVAYFLVVAAFVPEIATGFSLRNIFASMLPLLAVAVGQTIVMITGGIDLSAGATISLCSVAGASVMSTTVGLLSDAPPAVAVPAGVATMLVVGTLVGCFNGLAVALLRMPPFIVTLATMMFVSGLAVWVTKSGNVVGLPRTFRLVDRGSLAGIVPYSLLIVAALAAVAQVMLWRTLAGRWLYAVGLNAKAALVSGVPVRGVVVFAYACSGFCAAVASLLYTARMNTGSPTLGDAKLLDVIAAVVIGGTSLFGGKGSVAKTVSGALFLAVVTNTLDWFNLGDAFTRMVKGGIILAAAAADVVRNKVMARA